METETLIDSNELIEEHSNDNKEGVTSMGCKPNGSLAIKESVRVRCALRKSKPPCRFEL